MNSTSLEKVQVAWISGMPRSGTTWLSQIFASAPDVRLKFCPLFSYEFKNALDENGTKDDWKKLYAALYQTNSEFLDQDHLRKHGLIPFFERKKDNPGHLIIKSTRFHNLTRHIIEASEQVQFIHIVRHPCATIYSWLANPEEFPEQADPMKEWRTGRCRKTGPGEFWGFDDWKKVTTQALALRETYPFRFKILRYEDLVKNPKKATENIFDFLDIKFEKQTRDFISLSQSKHDDRKHSVFKNPKLIGKWEEKLSPTIISECLKEIRGTELGRFIMS